MTTHSTVIIAARVSLSFVFLVFAVPLALNAKRCLLGGNGSFGGSGQGATLQLYGFYSGALGRSCRGSVESDIMNL